MALRLVAAVAAATALLAPAAYGASDRPQVRDAKGDVRGGMAELDIVSARWSTAGRGADEALVVTMTLAAAPKDGVPFAYHVRADVRDCGEVSFSYHPGSVSARQDGNVSTGWAACGDGIYDDVVTTTVKGTTITWSMPVAVLPSQVRPGAVFTKFEALADASEPIFGYSVAGIADEPLDYAQGDGSWRMA
ncbi:MAG TPA: hypothetical protein VGX28_03745 [Frankiaceae bacterium]|nr:hypothetical protein [Frankiaceae bacterium]